MERSFTPQPHSAGETIKQVVAAEYFSQIKKALIAIQQTLGLLPNGVSATVKARLDIIDSMRISHTHMGGENGPKLAPAAITPQGGGSNLDADKLDAQHGSYFLDRANHTGSVLPGAISPQGTGSGLDADTVDGKHVSELVSTGSVVMFASITPPEGWLSCNGAAISRATYSALFAIIGTSYGVGDGSTTFNVPDFRGRGPLGSGTGTGLTARSLGAVGGAETHILDATGMPAHTHSVGISGAATSSDGGGTRMYNGGSINTGSAGGGLAHNNMQPWLGVNFIIKA